MALPPLIFLAAGRATRRVILSATSFNFLPLSEVTHRLVTERLGTDTFHLAGVAKELKPDLSCRVLTKLQTQRRMRTEIADVARHLVYTGAGLNLLDHPEVDERKLPDWLEFLPPKPLLIVDTETCIVEREATGQS